MWTAAFALACLVNIVGVYWPSQPGPAVGVSYLDKVVHLLLFAAVAITGRRCGVPTLALAGVLVVHAVSSEWVQEAWLAERSGDVYDAACDLAGLAVGLVVTRVWPKREAGLAPWGDGEAGRSRQEGFRP